MFKRMEDVVLAEMLATTDGTERGDDFDADVTDDFDNDGFTDFDPDNQEVGEDDEAARWLRKAA